MFELTRAEWVGHDCKFHAARVVTDLERRALSNFATPVVYFSVPHLRQGVVSPIIVGADVAYVCAGNSRLLALDASTGTLLWAAPASRAQSAGVALSSDQAVVYMVNNQRGMFALDASTGSVWLPTEKRMGVGVLERALAFALYFVRLLVRMFVLLLLLSTSLLAAVMCRARQVMWTFNYTVSYPSTVVSSDGSLYLAEPKSVVSVSRTGSLRWRSDSNLTVNNMAVTADGKVLLVGNRDGAVVGLDSATGSTLWRSYFTG